MVLPITVLVLSTSDRDFDLQMTTEVVEEFIHFYKNEGFAGKLVILQRNRARIVQRD